MSKNLHYRQRKHQFSDCVCRVSYTVIEHMSSSRRYLHSIPPNTWEPFSHHTQEASSIGPLPLRQLLRINTLMESPGLRLNLRIQQLLPRARPFIAESRDPIDSRHSKTIPINTISNRQFERRINVALLSIATNMDIALPLAPIRQAVH